MRKESTLNESHESPLDDTDELLDKRALDLDSEDDEVVEDDAGVDNGRENDAMGDRPSTAPSTPPSEAVAGNPSSTQADPDPDR